MNNINEEIQLEEKVKNILKFYSAGNYEEVEARTKPLIKKFPDIIELYNLLALAYNGLNKTNEAIKLLNGAKRKDPNNIHILNNLGMIHSGLNNFENAKEVLNKALDLKPDFFQAANNLSNLLLKLNKADEAINLLKKFINNKENLNNYVLNFTIGNAYQQSGDFKNARYHYEKCLKIDHSRCDPDKAISLMTNYKNDESNHLSDMEKKLKNKLSKTDLMLLNYSLGKAYEDLENYSKSFIHLKNANKLNYELTNYSSSLENKKFENIKLDSSHLKLIQQAMFKVVNDQKGTAFKNMSNEFKYSGKTGTSQVKKISLEERESEDFRKKEQEWKNKDHALFVGYLPSVNPKYAISVIIEHGGSGAKVAAPIAKKIFDYLYENKIT